jgi:hypothetical protein
VCVWRLLSRRISPKPLIAFLRMLAGRKGVELRPLLLLRGVSGPQLEKGDWMVVEWAPMLEPNHL